MVGAVSTEFHRLIQGIVLHPAKYRSPERYVSVHIKPDATDIRPSMRSSADPGGAAFHSTGRDKASYLLR